MKYVVFLVFFTGCLFQVGVEKAKANGSAVVDSVGFEKVDGKIFVLHKVNQGQTMFAVVRQYGTTIQALRDANPGMPDQIKSGQTIRVPYTSKTVVAAEPKKTAPAPVSKPAESKPQPATTTAPTATPAVAVAANGIHKVEGGETLYRVAVKYGVLMAEIRKWNNLTDDNLHEGQQLIVSEKSVGKINSEPATHAPPKVVASTVVKDSVKAKAVVAEKVAKPVEEVAPPKVVKGTRKSESGLAEVIETDESTSKFLGLHRTAPIGSLVEVLNEYNQEKIIVRIIGRIPDTSINDDIVIKLSSRAFEKVSPNSKRFRAVVSYLE